MSYRYDLFNRLAQAEKTDGRTSTYTYKYLADGRRIETPAAYGIKIRQHWDGDKIIAEFDANNGAQITEYFYGNGSYGYVYSGLTSYYEKDPHGNVVHTTNDRGIDTKYEYDAYGNHTAESQYSVPNPMRYCGEYYDSETGLIYLRNRYYDPEIGRFITEDPARDGLNWYVYCNNDPVNCIDPLGLEYGKLRDFVYDYYLAFNGDIKIETADGLNFAYVTMGNYGRAFYFDGTIVEREYDNYSGRMINEKHIKIADNIDGNLYLQRSAFVTAMRMTEDGTANVKTTDEYYVSDFTAMLDFATYINGSISSANDIKDIYDIMGKAPTVGKVIRNLAAASNIMNAIKQGYILSSGMYRSEAVTVQVGEYKHITATMYGTETMTKDYQFYVKFPSWYGIPSAPEYR